MGLIMPKLQGWSEEQMSKTYVKTFPAHSSCSTNVSSSSPSFQRKDVVGGPGEAQRVWQVEEEGAWKGVCAFLEGKQPTLK